MARNGGAAQRRALSAMTRQLCDNTGGPNTICLKLPISLEDALSRYSSSLAIQMTLFRFVAMKPLCTPVEPGGSRFGP